MTLSLEFLATIVAIFAVVAPGAFYLGKLSTRVESVEKNHDTIFRKLDELADAIREATRSNSVLHCPLSEDERCAFRNTQIKERE